MVNNFDWLIWISGILLGLGIGREYESRVKEKMKPEESHLHPPQCEHPQPTSTTLICSAGESSLEFVIKVLQLLVQYEGRAASVEIKEVEQ